MKKLYRNKTEYKIAGVCSGIGDYFNIDCADCPNARDGPN